MLRFQVKTLASDAPCLRFPAQTNTTDSYIGAVEWMAFHSLHHGITAFLKPEEVGVRPTLRYDDDDEELFRGIRGVRYARDYPLERVIKETLS